VQDLAQAVYLTLGLTILGGYLLGSIPFGLIATRLGGAGDIRQIGSGNIGATNVLRSGRKDLAAITLIGDAGKGVVAVLLARWLSHGNPAIIALAGGAAFTGHLFPVWLKFKGGKGVATFYGVLLAACWPVGVLAAVTWLAVAALLRISSLAALVAAALAAPLRPGHRPGSPVHGALPVHGGADLHPPQGQHQPPAEGPGAPHRQEEDG
jgi:glycerol-3-phosphate acyltransferase PlsY